VLDRVLVREKAEEVGRACSLPGSDGELGAGEEGGVGAAVCGRTPVVARPKLLACLQRVRKHSGEGAQGEGG
jgi:hypothetical protein